MIVFKCWNKLKGVSSETKVDCVTGSIQRSDRERLEFRPGIDADQFPQSNKNLTDNVYLTFPGVCLSRQLRFSCNRDRG